VKKNCLVLCLSIALGCAMARADVIDIAFDHSSQTGSPGDTLVFFGTLTNTGSDTVFLNSDSLNLSGFPLSSITDLFANVPLSLAGGANSGDIKLFDIVIPNAFPSGGNAGNYALLGGGMSDLNIVGAADLTVKVEGISSVPEPSFRTFLILVLALLAVVRWVAEGKIAINRAWLRAEVKCSGKAVPSKTGHRK
jgi:hypothetical protein